LVKNDDVTKNVKRQTKEERLERVVTKPTTVAAKAPDKLNDFLSYPLFEMYKDTNVARNILVVRLLKSQ